MLLADSESNDRVVFIGGRVRNSDEPGLLDVSDAGYETRQFTVRLACPPGTSLNGTICLGCPRTGEFSALFDAVRGCASVML